LVKTFIKRKKKINLDEPQTNKIFRPLNSKISHGTHCLVIVVVVVFVFKAIFDIADDYVDHS